MVSIAPTQSNILAALRNFLLAVLPATGSDGLPIQVVVGQTNRVPQVTSVDFVIITPIRVERLETNVDSYQDCRFTGSIAAAVLTVSAVQIGIVQPGATLSSNLVTAGTTIISQLTGPTGGAGTYQISQSQTVVSSTISAGGQTLQQALRITIQLDFHSANDTDAGDMASIVSTCLRDGFGVQQFANQSPNYGVVPLYADDAIQAPYQNDQQQIEWRWVVSAVLQANAIVVLSQQFSDAVALDLVSVDATYAF
ncbi:phage neck terminator protein [Bradyrhizobium sp.]